MRRLRTRLAIVAGLFVLAALALIIPRAAARTSFEPARSSRPQVEDSTTSTTAEDLPGNCDEAEHANDPECTGVAVPPGTVPDDDADDVNEDLPGNCDEAEHANDPECTGVTTGTTVNDDDANDDNQGPSANSGPGSQNSGPGNATDDDRGDDHGGHDSGDDGGHHDGGDDGGHHGGDG